MSSHSYFRAATAAAVRYAQIFPVIAITGPRQSGKTTMARRAFPNHQYLSFEDADTLIKFETDPRQFLTTYTTSGVIFDEVQHVPALFSYLQGIVDSHDITGKFVLTGSQNFLLNENITQTLAGRVGYITLLPLSISELGAEKTPLERILQGGYPRLHKINALPYEFYPNYINSYLEKDARQLRNIDNLSLFQTFIRLCAARTGQLLNLNALANECGIAQTTARGWLSVLEASYIVFLLKPYHTNFNKRLTKMPKLYFYDTGVICSLLNIQTTSQLEEHYLKGALFENFGILEILKGRLNRALQPNLYFWRDSTGREIDLIDEWGAVTNLFEFKSGFTFNSRDAAHLTYFTSLIPQARKYIVYGAAQPAAVAGDIHTISLEKLDSTINSPNVF